MGKSIHQYIAVQQQVRDIEEGRMRSLIIIVVIVGILVICLAGVAGLAIKGAI
jgi:CHASE3 domain sensor protein